MDRHTRRGLQLVLGLGVGLGLMGGAVAAALMPRPGLTDDQVRERARALGMLPITVMPQAPPKTIVVYTVLPSMSFAEIAAMLKQAGVLSDEQALTTRAEARDAVAQVKAGVYTITIDPTKPGTPDQLIDQLLKGPS